MWKHFPPKTDALAPEACFAICSGLMTGLRTPFSGRIQIVGKSPLTGTWADSNSGGSVCSHLRQAGYDALVVARHAPRCRRCSSSATARSRSSPPASCGARRSRETFDALKARSAASATSACRAIGPAGEKQQRIAAVMNDRYHAFGRQGFGAIYGSKNLKAIVVGGHRRDSGRASPTSSRRSASAITDEYKRDLGLVARFFAYMAKPKSWLGWMYRLMTRHGHEAAVADGVDAPAVVAARHHRGRRAVDRERRRADQELDAASARATSRSRRRA